MSTVYASLYPPQSNDVATPCHSPYCPTFLSASPSSVIASPSISEVETSCIRDIYTKQYTPCLLSEAAARLLFSLPCDTVVHGVVH